MKKDTLHKFIRRMKKKFEDTGSCSWQDGEHNEAEESHQDDLGEDPPDKAMLQRMMRSCCERCKACIRLDGSLVHKEDYHVNRE